MTSQSQLSLYDILLARVTMDITILPNMSNEATLKV
jgi:hypothetical protein